MNNTDEPETFDPMPASERRLRAAAADAAYDDKDGPVAARTFTENVRAEQPGATS